eukprot:2360826-Pyramimonas_sp.AAC.1
MATASVKNLQRKMMICWLGKEYSGSIVRRRAGSSGFGCKVFASSSHWLGALGPVPWAAAR